MLPGLEVWRFFGLDELTGLSGLGDFWFFGADDAICVFVKGNSVEIFGDERTFACLSGRTVYQHIQVFSSESLQELSVRIDGGHSIDGKQLEPVLCWVPGAVHFHAVG